MSTDSVVIERILEVVNRIIKTDPDSAKALLLTRVPCDESLKDDPAVRVREETVDLVGSGEKQVKSYSISPLGLLCGIAGTHPNGYAKVAAIFETVCPDHGKVFQIAGQPCPIDNCIRTVVLGNLLGLIETREENP